MGVEIWFKDDIRNILLSVNASSADAVQWTESPRVSAYRHGYQAALYAVALACGIPPGQVSIRSEAEIPRRVLRDT